VVVWSTDLGTVDSGEPDDFSRQDTGVFMTLETKHALEQACVETQEWVRLLLGHRHARSDTLRKANKLNIKDERGARRNNGRIATNAVREVGGDGQTGLLAFRQQWDSLIPTYTGRI
jgi:hypothetical protein